MNGSCIIVCLFSKLQGLSHNGINKIMETLYKIGQIKPFISCLTFPSSSHTAIQRNVLGFHERRLVVLKILRGGRLILKIQFEVDFKRICIHLKEIGCTLFLSIDRLTPNTHSHCVVLNTFAPL